MGKIAFLFLTIDGINHETLWKNFVDGKRSSNYMHSKNNIKHDWIRSIPIVDTGWGYIVDAYISLLSYAVRDPNNEYFVTISETCIPICSFNHFYSEVNKLKDKSMVKLMDIWKYDQQLRIESEPNFDNLGINFIKHYARFCLSRKHVIKLLHTNFNILNHFCNMQVGDEFFLSSISKHKNDFVDKAITFDNWDAIKKEVEKLKQGNNKELIEKLNRNPKTYTNITEEDIVEATNTDCFFWRKFPKTTTLHEPYYVHIPKTAGTTIEQICYKYGYKVGSGYFYKNRSKLLFLQETEYKDISPWHIPLKYMSKEVQADANSKIKFAVVRNPYERIISDFKFWHDYYEVRKKEKPKSLENINTFVDSFKSDKLIFDCHFTPMSEYIDDNTHILRFETLSSDFKIFVKKFGFIIDGNDIDTTKANNTKNKSINNSLLIFNPNSISFIKEYYTEDFKKFNYSSTFLQ